VLDADFVDGVLLRAHHELLRLSEEFQQGKRVHAILQPVLEALRAGGVPPPYRVVDVGCGLGFVVRWLAAKGDLGADVTLVGCDYNAALIGRAQALAAEERLACRFAVANAFRLAEPATVFMSTGVMHHFRGDSLPRFLAQQANAHAFVHSDIKPTYLAPLGSWLFHQARMREPLARHDGLLSALRAHPGAALVAAARAACPDLAAGLFDGGREAVPLLRVMQALVGVRRTLAPRFVGCLGALAGRLGALA
jgi:SAM-dependent methyltransferase